MSTQDELLATAQEQLRWTKAAVMGTVRETLLSVLDRSEFRRAYESMDGTRTQKQISEAAGVSTGSASNYGRAWRSLGLVYENSEGRLEHLVSLSDLGIPLET